MNVPAVNRRALDNLLAFSGSEQPPAIREAGQQAVKMEAALRLVLLFHSDQVWDKEFQNLGCHVSSRKFHPGRDLKVDPLGTKFLIPLGMCSVIREVLGEVV